MSPLRQLAYVSTISIGLTKAAERSIVGVAKRNNRRSGLTGIIASSGRHFLQVVEGSSGAIDELFAKLLVDPRHCDVRVLFDRAVTERKYANWSMGYVFNLDLADELRSLHSGEAKMEPEELLSKYQLDEYTDVAFGRISSFGQFTQTPEFDRPKMT